MIQIKKTPQVITCLLVIILFFSTPSFAQQSSSSSFETQQDSVQKENNSIIHQVEEWYKVHTNYATITILMAVESSLIPFPSEVVIPPAAYTASEPDSDLNIVLVVLFGTLGALIGALINYFLAMWLGRLVIYKFAESRMGKLCLLSREKIEKAETYFNENGNISTFIGRLIPGIRQLISIPAGLARMNLLNFMIYTTLGAGIWNVILALIGYLAHGQQDIIHQYSHLLSIALLVFGVLFIAYILFKVFKKAKKK